MENFVLHISAWTRKTEDRLYEMRNKNAVWFARIFTLLRKTAGILIKHTGEFLSDTRRRFLSDAREMINARSNAVLFPRYLCSDMKRRYFSLKKEGHFSENIIKTRFGLRVSLRIYEKQRDFCLKLQNERIFSR